MQYTIRKILTTSLLVAYCQCVSVQGFLLYEKATLVRQPSDEGNEALTLVTWNDERVDDLKCEMFTDQRLIQVVVKISGIVQVYRPSTKEMQEMEEECNSLKRRRTTKEVPNMDAQKMKKEENKWYNIYPGTKWCGPGNIAKNDSDLGVEADTDKCCRAHDKCNDTINAGKTKHGMKNEGKYTRLSCECDNAFHSCLTAVNSFTSNTIGNIYFNTLMGDCFQKDYPQTNTCKKYRKIWKNTCLEYEKDTTKSKVYQWFPAQDYRQLPGDGTNTTSLSPSTSTLPTTSA